MKLSRRKIPRLLYFFFCFFVLILLLSWAILSVCIFFFGVFCCVRYVGTNGFIFSTLYLFTFWFIRLPWYITYPHSRPCLHFCFHFFFLFRGRNTSKEVFWKIRKNIINSTFLNLIIKPRFVTAEGFVHLLIIHSYPLLFQQIFL